MKINKRSIAKYRAAKVKRDGVVFDSKKEAQRFEELRLLEDSGAILGLARQVKFVLIPSQYEVLERFGKGGRRLADGRRLIERECAYVADFCYYNADGEYVVEDVKGFKTKDYIIKRKLMLFLKGIKICEI